MKIGNLDISSFKVGGADCSIYLGSVKMYPTEEPTYQGFCKLTLNDSSVVELEGSSELTQSMISSYQSTLVSAEIGTLCTSIGQGAFQNCQGLTSVTIGSGVTSIGYGAFAGCMALTSIDIPNNVTTIDAYAFSSCAGLTSINLPSSVTSISRNTFENCTGLTSVTIPNGVTSIGGYAFNYCTSLTSVNIPSSVTSISSYNTFANCTSLTRVTVNVATPLTLRSDSTAFDNTNDCPIYVPSQSVNAYKSASGWSTYASRIQAIPA